MMKYICLGVLLITGLQQTFAQTTAFTYQGRLSDSGGTANGAYDFEFVVFAESSGGTPIAGPTGLSGVAVTNGYFTVTLDFGVGIFTGAERWLELGVRTNGGTSFTTLAPRTAVTPTPYALHAQNVASGGVVGTHSEGVTFNNPANVFVGEFSGDGTGVTNVNAATLDGLSATEFWQLGGNAGTIPGANFLGTIDNQPLELKVDGARAMRLEPALETPNVIGGVGANSVTPGVRGATIAGGGLPAFPNQVTADYGAVGGGTFNIASAPWATIAGGRDNRARSESTTVAGGFRNSIQTNSNFGTIGGGVFNLIQSNSASATISGGAENVVETNATFAAIGGGLANVNQPHSPYGTIPGGWRNQVGPGSTAVTVGGGENNRAAANHATVAGGLNNNNTGPGATIGGGNGNLALANDNVIGGGFFNTISNGAFSATISGGRQNLIQSGSEFAAIGGGAGNVAGAYHATIAGGTGNQALGFASSFGGGQGNVGSSDWVTISGGLENSISTNSNTSTISGGWQNQIGANTSQGTIGGGSQNRMGGNSYGSTIAGGTDNQVQDNAWRATIGGGAYNSVAAIFSGTVSGGTSNQLTASASQSVISGGQSNTVTAQWGMIPGGRNNAVSGDYSLAAGRRARANNSGSFVWADATDADFATTGNNQFIVRASGGVGINTNNPTAKLHIAGTPGVDGIRFPDGTLQTSAAAPPAAPPQVYFNNGSGSNPATTNNFLTTPLVVTITSPAQKILVTAHKALGSTSVAGAVNLDLYIGYRAVASVAEPSTVGGGVWNNRVSQNTQVTMGLSGVINNLVPGNYQVGLVGNSPDAANWNSNDYGYTTAVVY
jgi:hypothetical protein